MKTHELKTHPEYFEAIRDGRKKFEARKDDRDFQPHDTVILREYCPERQNYTGRQQEFTITYKVSKEELEKFEVDCVFGIERVVEQEYCNECGSPLSSKEVMNRACTDCGEWW